MNSTVEKRSQADPAYDPAELRPVNTGAVTGSLRPAAGFTLLEIILVVIVVAFLVAITTPRVLNTAERDRALEAKNMIGAIKTAQDLYKLENGRYTAEIEDLDVRVAISGIAAFWAFNLSDADIDSYRITATRTGKDASPNISKKTIRLDWDDATGENWSGTYPYLK